MALLRFHSGVARRERPPARLMLRHHSSSIRTATEILLLASASN